MADDPRDADLEADQDSEPTMTAPLEERPLGSAADGLVEGDVEPHSSGLAESPDVLDAE